jgi:uncharacterized protein (DUF2235 family)
MAARPRPAAGRNIVICCDGTGNEIGVTISNVLKLFRIAEKSDRQRVWYNAGVGTIGQQNPWTRAMQKARGFFGLATGLGLDDHVLAAYRFLCSTYQDGDRVYLFGFSRGAYTVRALAAFVHVMGIFRPDQLNIAGYAWTAFKRASARDGDKGTPAAAGQGVPPAEKLSPLEEAWHFSRVIGGKPITIHFVGVWDTVASVIVPRLEQLSLSLQTLRVTRTNPSVRMFRQAMAIDERRRMFRLIRWTAPQTFRPNPFNRKFDVAQDIRQVWFAGVHADIGGGYAEKESGLSKYPLAWLIEEAAAAGLLVNRAMVNHLVYGKARKGGTHSYTAPDFTAKLHRSLTLGWAPLEIIPKLGKWREWRGARPALFGLYLPLAEPRPIADGAWVHQSAIDRRAAGIGYAPVNWPATLVAVSYERAGTRPAARKTKAKARAKSR